MMKRMRSSPTGFWNALETISGCAAVDAEWKTKFGADYGFGKPFLRPTSNPASAYPCTVAGGCGCEHEIVTHGNDNIVALCRCERGCETFRLMRSDIVIYELNRPTLDTVIAKTFGLIPDNDGATELRGTTLIGAYSPLAGFRFSVYLTIQFEPDDLDEVINALLARSGSPFILLSPTCSLCSSKAEKQLTDKLSIFVPLSENVALDDKQRLQLLRPIDKVFEPFCKVNLPSSLNQSSRTTSQSPLLVTSRKGRFEGKFLRRDDLCKVAWQIEGESGSNLSATAALREAQRRSEGRIIPEKEFTDEFDSILQGYYDFRKKQLSTLQSNSGKIPR